MIEGCTTVVTFLTLFFPLQAHSNSRKQPAIITCLLIKIKKNIFFFFFLFVLFFSRRLSARINRISTICLHCITFHYLCTMQEERPKTDWLPLTKKEVEKRGL